MKRIHNVKVQPDNRENTPIKLQLVQLMKRLGLDGGQQVTLTNTDGEKFTAPFRDALETDVLTLKLAMKNGSDAALDHTAQNNLMETLRQVLPDEQKQHQIYAEIHDAIAEALRAGSRLRGA